MPLFSLKFYLCESELLRFRVQKRQVVRRPVLGFVQRRSRIGVSQLILWRIGGSHRKEDSNEIEEHEHDHAIRQ
jgi:hypothetical protein